MNNTIKAWFVHLATAPSLFAFLWHLEINIDIPIHFSRWLFVEHNIWLLAVRSTPRKLFQIGKFTTVLGTVVRMVAIGRLNGITAYVGITLWRWQSSHYIMTKTCSVRETAITFHWRVEICHNKKPLPFFHRVCKWSTSNSHSVFLC